MKIINKTKIFTIILSVIFSFAFFINSSYGQGWDTGNYEKFGLPSGSISDIVYNLMFWILAIFGSIGIIGFVIAGIMYLTAAGSETQSEKAKKAMMYSLIGVIVGLIGLVILFAVTNLLGGADQSF